MLNARLFRIPLLVCGLLPGLAFAGTLQFAPLPMQDPETVMRETQPMLEYLSQELEVDFEIRYATDYDEILERFHNGTVDLAYLGPLPYVSLRARYPEATPVVAFREPGGEAQYTCSVVMFADERRPLDDLTDQPVALTQPLSTCGYLATAHLLRDGGIRLAATDYRYLGHHDDVALAVVRGEALAGRLKTHIARNYAHLGLVTVAESEPLPGFALVANRDTVSDARLQELREALVRLRPAESDEDAERMAEWGESLRYGAQAVDDEDYAAVRRLHGEVAIPELGLPDLTAPAP
ncbi:PhnD/SsuA/transferrin family substrate-binding protein [Thioalkalivibrio sp. ALE23]|uniref:PhnD/SsuA/transferrin family substrate-binding protein n=1 Tax=Thioalkalivibrio sp. ALE23 TaxID=1265495 RepID=UPI00036781FA|nr:PhnD/SsuA/transferrin family substrate-binding protein [Thioalkalivibrio sp. ALE23]